MGSSIFRALLGIVAARCRALFVLCHILVSDVFFFSNYDHLVGKEVVFGFLFIGLCVCTHH